MSDEQEVVKIIFKSGASTTKRVSEGDAKLLVKSLSAGCTNAYNPDEQYYIDYSEVVFMEILKGRLLT